MIFKIAKTELRSLFYSPIAWFLMIVFMVQCAIVFTGALDSNAQAQEMGGRALEYMKDLTSRIYTGRGGLFDTVMKTLYLYIPLLTMGLISREINSGTIKLLYSSPIKITQIVFGKYLALMIYSFILLTIVAVFMAAGFYNIVSVDYGVLLSGALGFYLLLCTYSAIGLFMSSMSTYQVVAAIGSFIVIGTLSYIGTLWQNIDFVRDLTYFLSLSGRTEHMLKGLITTKDIFYFVIIVAIFLGFTILKLKSGTESKPFMVRLGRYVLVVAVALGIGYISSRSSMVGYLDTTRNQDKTLTPNAQAIIRELGSEKLEVTAYNNLFDNHNYIGFPEARNIYLSVWEPYTRFKPDISFKYINYFDSVPDMANVASQYPGKSLQEMAKLHAKNYRQEFSMFLTPQQIHQIVDLKGEENRFVMHLKYKNKSVFLRVFDDQEVFPSETEVSAAFRRLLNAKLPKIAFLTGNLERSIDEVGERDYSILSNISSFRNSLVNQGFDVQGLNLNTSEIPVDITTIVLADPKVALSPLVLQRLQKYIDNGGNILIAGEPGKQDIINPLLKQFGVQLLKGALVQPEKDHSADLITASISPVAADFYKPLKKSYRDGKPVTMPGAAALSLTSTGNFHFIPLLNSKADKSWLTSSKIVTDSAAIAFSAQNGDIRGTFPTAVGITRTINGKQQRIVVSGDADFMSNSELKRWNVQNANFLFSTGLYSWLNYGEFPIDTSRPESLDRRMKVSSAQVAREKILLIWILPTILAILGSVLLIRRKRR